MAQPKKNQTPQPVVKEAPKEPVPFTIKYPMLWLLLAVVAVYATSFQLGFTELDDTIFIVDKHDFNEHLSNIFKSFNTGAFGANDIYYRPLLLVSFLLNYQISGVEPHGYHIVNVLFHLASVLLLYVLLTKLEIKQWIAFTLTLLFAVHPVLSQAVAWIPGRNDTLLTIFILSFLITAINYSTSGRLYWLVLSVLALTAAFFTKETGVFAAPAAFVLLILVVKKNWLDKKMIVQYVCWVAIFALWFVSRGHATQKTNSLGAASVLHDFISRLPVVLQYLGKIFLPVNLNVFPIIDDTVNYFGFAAVAILAVLIALSKQRNWWIIGAGFALFLLFLIPVLIVPAGLNDQTFEHRLYLPMIGILLILSQTILFNNPLKESTVFMGFLALLLVLGGVNINHQQKFSDPLTFWTAAAEGSPHSAYAIMMHAARMEKEDKAEAHRQMRYAYTLNPNEKYLNFYYGTMLQDEDSVLKSEPYLLKEQKTSDYYECDFFLARVDFEKHDLPAAMKHLERYITRDPKNEQANNNLMLLYLDNNDKTKAQAQLKRMQANGLAINPQMVQRLNSMK